MVIFISHPSNKEIFLLLLLGFKLSLYVAFKNKVDFFFHARIVSVLLFLKW